MTPVIYETDPMVVGVAFVIGAILAGAIATWFWVTLLHKLLFPTQNASDAQLQTFADAMESAGHHDYGHPDQIGQDTVRHSHDTELFTVSQIAHYCGTSYTRASAILRGLIDSHQIPQIPQCRVLTRSQATLLADTIARTMDDARGSEAIPTVAPPIDQQVRRYAASPANHAPANHDQVELFGEPVEVPLFDLQKAPLAPYAHPARASHVAVACSSRWFGENHPL